MILNTKSSEELDGTHSLLEANFTPFIQAEKFAYLPPQLLQDTVYNGYINEKVDVYGWGMHFYRLLSGKPLPEIWKECELYKIQLNKYDRFEEKVEQVKEKWKNVPALGEKLHKLVKLALDYNEGDRPKFSELHEEIKNINL